VIQVAAARVGVIYVDARAALDGHRLCEARPGSVAVNGLTAGNDFPDKFGGPIGRESYHPNDFGHQLMENSVMANTQKLNQPMPVADPAFLLPTEGALDFVLNVPRSGRPLNALNYDGDMGNNVAYRGGLWRLTLKGLNFAIKGLSAVRLQMYSQPVDLGTYTTDVNGDLAAQIAIPADISPGFHQVHLYATNLAGEPLDIFKSIYVGASPTDLDGDGMADSADACVAVANSNKDDDKDGVDDSCDGNIGQPPAQAATVTLSGRLLAQNTQNYAGSGGQTGGAPQSINTMAASLSGRGSTAIGPKVQSALASAGQTLFHPAATAKSFANYLKSSSGLPFIASSLASVLLLWGIGRYYKD